MISATRRRLYIAALACAFVTALPAAQAADVEVRFKVCATGDVLARPLCWGIRRAGLEVASGQREGRRSGSAASDCLEFTATVPASALEGDAPADAWLCSNADTLESYVPSVGDTFARTRIGHSDGQWRVQVTAAEWQRRTVGNAGDLLTVHYHRTDDLYHNMSLWTWDEHLHRAPKENELLPVGRDAFGLVFQIDTGLYGDRGDAVGLVPRRNADWQYKDGGDRMWRPSMGDDVYIVQDDNRIHTEEPDVTPKVRLVTLDADHHLTVRFSHRLPVGDWTPDKFKLTTEDGEQLHVKAVWPFRHRGDRCAVYSVETDDLLVYPGKSYVLDVDGFGPQHVRIGHIVMDPARFYDADARLGANYTPASTTFRVFAPGATQAWVVVADTLEGDEGTMAQPMTVNDKGVWSVTVEGDLAGKYYAYRLGGQGFDPQEEITDVYATCTQARKTRSLIVDLSKTDPEGFRDYKYNGPMSPADAVVYELHIRDFTIADTSGIQHKGKYLGLTETGTHVPGDPSTKTGLDHLVEMGVTHVQIMPIQDFDNEETAGDPYNWGYMPVHFNSPDGWYASDPYGPAKIRELKEAIKALHDHGIGVILDVVYNHTAGWAPFEKLVPEYYYRLTDAGNMSNGSGCGNEFASEHPMARKFILDSLRFWVEEYEVDGFRFDLMGLIDGTTMRMAHEELSKIHPGILLYGEPWTGGSTPLKPITDKQQVAGTGIGAFSDGFRDAIKGDRDGGAPGFIEAGDRVWGVINGLKGGIDDWSRDPVDSVNYFEAHDNLTAWDKILQCTPDASLEMHQRMMRFGALILFTAQGMPFVHAGQEYCRTKGGAHNSYNLPDEINRLELKREHRDVFEYHRGMISLRKAHPALRLQTRDEVHKRMTFPQPPHEKSIVCLIDSAGVPGEPAGRILILLNGESEPKAFDLPAGEWMIYADADRAGIDVLGVAAGRVELPAHSGIMMAQ